MSELRIEGQAQGTAQTQRKAQPQKKENIVIEFTSLPNNMKTAKARAFYDKDGSGFIESNNANGQNEVALMQQAFGLDLSKYKSDIVKVKGNNGFDINGNKIREVVERNGKIIYRTCSPGYFKGKVNSFGTKQIFDENYKPTGFWSKCVCKPNDRYKTTGVLPNYDGVPVKQYENYGPNGTIGNAKLEISNQQGDVVATYEEKYRRKDKNGEINYETISEKRNVYEHRTLTKGKNTIVSHKKYNAKLPENESGIPYNGLQKMPIKTDLETETFTLNGKKVQAKPIGKGRYEVATEKGNIYYISHDGKILKPEYVRNNP